MAAAAIVVDHLDVRRGGRLVLDDISLSVDAGSVTGLLGPSGSGKTTLIRSVVGVQIVASGDVRVLGEPAGSKPLRRRVGYVTQSPAVYLDLAVGENLRYFARVLGVDRARAEEVLATVDLESFAGRVTSRLSGGQLARVSLATALRADTDVLVLDEPTVRLDPVLRRDLWETFHRLAAGGTTLLVSSHVMDEASRCDHLLLLREGRLLAALTPFELRERTGEDDLEAAFLRLVEGEVPA